MTAYRHINLLLDMTLYLELRDLSRKLGLPYSEIVRESLRKTIAVEKQEKKENYGQNRNS